MLQWMDLDEDQRPAPGPRDAIVAELTIVWCLGLAAYALVGWLL